MRNEKPTIKINGRDVRFTVRNYGRGQFYCWAEYRGCGPDCWISLGDPWPASRFPKRELEKIVPHETTC